MGRSVTAAEMVEEEQNQPNFPLKRIRLEEISDDKDEDRISRLPDNLLVEILSRLPATKCAVKTGALSKRWKQIWTSVPNFVFIHRGDPNADFVSFVDKTITQRGQLKLKKLDIDSAYNEQFEPNVLNWIRYALNCKVEELIMFLWRTDRLYWLELDECFFRNSHFTNLNLSLRQINPTVAISWQKLLSLHISFMCLDENVIENILSGSPLLETLVLKECYGYTRLDITSKSVKKLVFNGYVGNGDVIEINAPNILSLKIHGYLRLRKILLINVSSLVEANLDYKLYGDYEITRKEAKEETLKLFIIKLRNVKEFKFGSLCFMAICRLAAKGFIFPSNLKFCGNYYPNESESDFDESSDSELQERVDDATGSSENDDDDEADA